MFIPNYNNIVDCAENRVPKRLPLYEHNVAISAIEELTNNKFAELINGDDNDVNEFFKNYCNFFRDNGYDVVTFERCITRVLPNAGCLARSSTPPAITDRESFDSYPWDTLVENYFNSFTSHFTALRNNMPQGMKAIGGVGNGVFECVQDVVGYEALCYLREDDYQLYCDLFKRFGDISYAIWERFLNEFGDVYCVLRFGDDLGFKNSTLLSSEDIAERVMPEYKRIVSLIHSHNKPFLLHSCGCIFNIMDDLIDEVGIDAKHSNEDEIAPFEQWSEQYGERIGNFGGLDLNAICAMENKELTEYILNIIKKCEGRGGFAIGSGNSIADYVPPQRYKAMIDIVRSYRGE